MIRDCLVILKTNLNLAKYILKVLALHSHILCQNYDINI